jgi:hypothetical protein
MVERQAPRADRAERAGRHRDHEDVLVALARAEDEEAVAPVVRHQGDTHGPDDGGTGEGRQRAEQQQNPGADLGDRGKNGVEAAGADADGLEPAGRAGQLAAAERVVEAVREDGPAQGQAQQRGAEIDVGHGHDDRVTVRAGTARKFHMTLAVRNHAI